MQQWSLRKLLLMVTMEGLLFSWSVVPQHRGKESAGCYFRVLVSLHFQKIMGSGKVKWLGDISCSLYLHAAVAWLDHAKRLFPFVAQGVL